MYPIFTAQPVLLDACRAGKSEGFAEFGPEHLVWLVVCAALVVVCVWRYVRLRRGGVPRSLRLLRGMAAVMLVCLVSEDGLMVATGTFWPAWWPLHFCNFAEFFCMGYSLRPNRACRELLLSIGLGGSLMALLFPGWSYCPAYTWPVICGFVEHALIFATSLCALSDRRELPRWRDLGITAAFVTCYVLFFRWFNVALGANFGFVTEPAAGSPLEAWAETWGSPGYLVPYALVFAAVTVCLHGAMALVRRIWHT